MLRVYACMPGAAAMLYFARGARGLNIECACPQGAGRTGGNFERDGGKPTITGNQEMDPRGYHASLTSL